MSKLDVSPWGPDTTWIAHTPYSGDWCNFQDPEGPYLPFNLGDGYLTIRAQLESDGQYYGGLLSSVDPKGNGFSQQWGYFEMKAMMPKGPGTWPAFWLLDMWGLMKLNQSSQEIDIVEYYGADADGLFTTLHLWTKTNWGLGVNSRQCSMTTGFHTYGLDLQPDFLTFYYDRQQIWQVSNSIPGYNDSFNRPMYVLVNLAYGGGDSNNNASSLEHGPKDLLVEYVRVWQGSGGSQSGNSTASALSLSFTTAGLTVAAGEKIAINGSTLLVTSDGDAQVNNSTGGVVWHTGTNADCSSPTACKLVFQNDGNLVMYLPAGSNGWASNSWGNNMGSLEFANSPPYLQVFDENCNAVWSSEAIP